MIGASDLPQEQMEGKEKKFTKGKMRYPGRKSRRSSVLNGRKYFLACMTVLQKVKLSLLLLSIWRKKGIYHGTARLPLHTIANSFLSSEWFEKNLVHWTDSWPAF